MHDADPPPARLPPAARRSCRPAAALPAAAAATSAALDLDLSTHAAAAAAAAGAQLLGDVGEGLEAPVQLAYLVTLMGFLVVGAYLVVRQVLIRRELEEAAKVLGERVRTGEATSEVRRGAAHGRHAGGGGPRGALARGHAAGPARCATLCASLTSPLPCCPAVLPNSNQQLPS